MRHIAFALDPDGYWVEIIGQKNSDDTKDIKTTETSSYRFNHSMIRIKDAERSLKFYQDVMGMKLLRTNEQKEAKFTLYFLGYHDPPNERDTANGVNPLADKEGVFVLYILLRTALTWCSFWNSLGITVMSKKRAKCITTATRIHKVSAILL